MKKLLIANAVLFLSFTLLCLSSCNQNRQNSEQESTEPPIDVTVRKPNGDPVGTHRDAQGLIYNDNNIFAPRENETEEVFKRRTGYGSQSTQSQYDKGYEDGYQDAVDEGVNQQ